jgi:hypothetical protein
VRGFDRVVRSQANVRNAEFNGPRLVDVYDASGENIDRRAFAS